jgi:hypothetical protein
MKKFVVGFLNFHENDIKLEIVHANTKVEACIQFMEFWGWDLPEYALASMEGIDDFCANCDTTISVIEI